MKVQKFFTKHPVFTYEEFANFLALERCHANYNSRFRCLTDGKWEVQNLPIEGRYLVTEGTSSIISR